MCGIIGFTTGDKNKIINSLKTIKHRGPDDEGIYIDDKVSLGHVRLSILDLSSNAGQPMTSEDGQAVLLHNGEIYNFRELKKELIQKGYKFKSAGDTEVILNGYIDEGVNFFSKLRGMWAFVIYDRIKDVLILSRDYFGIKPLYWAIENGRLFFSSEMKGIASLTKNLEPNSQYYFQFLNLGYFPAPETCYRNVKKLEPNEILIWDLKKREMAKYRNKLSERELKLNYCNSFDEAKEFLNRELLDSVLAHFVSDVPVGLLFSGGNDSSLLAAMAKKLGLKFTAYNLNIAGNIDSIYARKISKELNLDLVQEEFSEKSLEEQYERVWEIIDEPFADISVIPTSLIFSIISKNAKVVLSGEGGDELFGGYLRNNFLAGKNIIKKNNNLIALLNHFSRGTNNISLKYINPVINRLRNKILDNFDDDIIGTYLSRAKIIDYPFQYRKIREYLYNFHLKFEEPLKDISPNLFFDRFLYLPNDLMYKADISSMRYSVEARVPYLDKNLFNFIIEQIRPKYCLSPEYGQKIILKKVLEKYLPKDLVYRPKRGFSFSFKKYACPQFQSDVKEALKFHHMNPQEFGLTEPDLRNLFDPRNSGLLIKKYANFAFALVSNWKVFKKIF